MYVYVLVEVDWFDILVGGGYNKLTFLGVLGIIVFVFRVRIIGNID